MRRSVSESAALDNHADLPRDDDGPVFREPWEAQAFAMTLELHQAGQFTWHKQTFFGGLYQKVVATARHESS